MATINPQIPSNPKAIAETGEKIYNDKYRAQYESEHSGSFVAINVRTEHATLGATPEEALDEARKNDPLGIFHLIRVGSIGAFRVSYTLHENNDWLSR
jgi:hypothetical protein